MVHFYFTIIEILVYLVSVLVRKFHSDPGQADCYMAVMIDPFYHEMTFSLANDSFTDLHFFQIDGVDLFS